MSEFHNSGAHERWEGDAAAFALDALEADELRAFEEHLADCAKCRDDIDTMRSAVEALPALTPVMKPPPELKERVMSKVRAEAALQTGSTAQTASPSHKRRGLSWGRWPVPVATAAATVVVALVAGLLAASGGRPGRTYAGLVNAPGATSSVHVSGTRARLSFKGLPAPPPRLIYEMWLKRPGQPPAPTRVLFSLSSGSVPVPGSLQGVQSVLVTAERRPYGSTVPTRRPIIVVKVA